MPLGSVSPFRPTGTVSVSVTALSSNVPAIRRRRHSRRDQYNCEPGIYPVWFRFYCRCIDI